MVGLEVTGFRAFSGPQKFDLDADAVIVLGANGQGKTSLFDAILWAFTGSIPRLGAEDAVLSLYSDSGIARVAVGLRLPDGKSARVVRSYDGSHDFRVEIGDDSYSGKVAETQLLRLIWPSALAAATPWMSLSSAITRSVYLQQDLVREFIDADEEADRFAAVSELVGVGRISELQDQLERQRRAWSRVTNDREKQLSDQRQRLARLESQLAEMASREDAQLPDVETAWNSWWTRSIELGLETDEIPSVASGSASASLNAAVVQLSQLHRAADRRLELAKNLLNDLQERTNTQLPDLDELRKEAASVQRALEAERQKLEDLREQAAELRRQQVLIEETAEELKLLAEMALRHLDDKCPVCDQDYDRPSTQHRLEKLLLGHESTSIPTDQLDAAAAEVERLEGLAGRTLRSLQEAEAVAAQEKAASAERSRRLAELGIEATAGAEHEALVSALSDLESKSLAFESLRDEGERLALGLARISELARRTELLTVLEATRAEVATLKSDVGSRTQTGSLASEVIEGLRAATYDVVEAQLSRIEPLLQRIYASVDPHPSFRNARLGARFHYGKGRLAATVDDTVSEITSEQPAQVMSSSQVNALAVSIFLSLNLGVGGLPLDAAILDDPLQTLDDVNLLGLIDLLRRTKDRKQLVVSTHDARFGRLLERKLRPIRASQRTCVIELQGWSRLGPTVTQREVVKEDSALKIA